MMHGLTMIIGEGSRSSRSPAETSVMRRTYLSKGKTQGNSKRGKLGTVESNTIYQNIRCHGPGLIQCGFI